MCKSMILLDSFLYALLQSKNTSNYQQPLYQMPRQSRKSKALPVPTTIPEDSYECERILDLRIEKGQRYYLIKWKGYDNEDDNTWQPITNLEYLMEDLLQYEEVHATDIQKLENQWRQLYQDKKSRFPLQPFDISEMQKKLQTWKHQTEEPSDQTEEKNKKNKEVCNKQKGIYKNRQRSKKITKVKQQVLEQNYSHSASPLPVPKKRGRPRMIPNIPSEEITINKMPQPSQNNQQNDDVSCQRPVLFGTPCKKEQNTQAKGTVSQERCINNSLQDGEINEADKFIDQIINRPDPINLSTLIDSFNSPLQKKAESPQHSLDQIPSQKCINDQQQVPQPKKETIFKMTNSSKYHYDSISLNSNHSPLHNNLMKYIYRKKKRTQKNQSQSQSHNNEPIKPVFRNAIIQLQQQNKDHSSISNKSFHKNEDLQQAERDGQRPQQQVEQGQEQQGQIKELVLYENIEQLPLIQQQQQPSLPQQSQVPAVTESIHVASNKIVLNQNNEQQNEVIKEIVPSQSLLRPVQVEEILSNLSQSQQNHKPVQFIDLESQNHQAKQSQQLQEQNVTSSKPQLQKSKKIKKQTRQIKISPQRKEGKGITGRSQESLLLTEQGQLFYRPSLNTLFQNMLSTKELKLLPQAKLLKIISQFKIQNIIFFTVQMSIGKEVQMRFMCYQSLREYFARELLIYLQENGKIEL